MHLKAWREAAGFATQEELADACGLPQAHISALELGKYPNPTGRTLRALAGAFTARLGRPVSSDDLFAPPPGAPVGAPC